MLQFFASAGLSIFGVAIGEVMRRRLNSLAYRRGELECAQGHPGTRRWIPVVVGLALLALSWAFLPGQWPMLLLTAPVAVGGIWISAVDLDVHRLPEAVVLPLLAWTLVGVASCSFLLQNVSFLSALAGAASLGGFLWILNLASAGGLGFGDVKLGTMLGGIVGAQSLPGVWAVGMLAFVAALIVAYVPERRDDVALGPLLVSAWLLVTAWSL